MAILLARDRTKLHGVDRVGANLYGGLHFGTAETSPNTKSYLNIVVSTQGLQTAQVLGQASCMKAC